jgi:hypothetical protein
MVTGGALFLPLTAQVLRDVVDVSMAAPEELTQITFVMGIPPAPFVPVELVGTPAVVIMPVHAGDLEAGAAAMAPFRSIATPIMDAVGPMPYPAMYQLTDGAAEPGPAVVRSAFLGGLDAAGAEAIVELHGSPAGAAAMTQLRVLGGAMGRVRPDATAFAHRDAPVMFTSMAFVSGAPEDATRLADGMLAAVAGPAAGVYANFLGDEDTSRIGQAYPGATYERLVAVKRRVDPANVFAGNHNIRP